tara:strand:+ start:642 stop:803 length:162 start_codon:yes stop_codon:yes gene_type:complete
MGVLCFTEATMVKLLLGFNAISSVAAALVKKIPQIITVLMKSDKPRHLLLIRL